jgi:hypothetical protein
VRIFKEFRGMSLKGQKIIEGVDITQDASVDQAHEHVTDVCAVLCLKKHRIFAMEYSSLECLFTKVVVEWRIGFAEKKGQGSPMLEHI